MSIGAPDPKSFYNNVMPAKVGADYEYARWKSNPLLSAQYEMMRDVLARWVVPTARKASRVIEVGPGPGTWTNVLLAVNPSAKYTLVDISHEMLSQAREVLKDRANVSFVESDFLALVPAQSFDFFFSSRAIEYMSDKRAVTKKIASLLAAGARGAVITKMPKPFFDFIRGRSDRSFHSSQVRPAALCKLFKENGLAVEEVRIATATVPLLGIASLNRLAYQLLRYIPIFFPLTLFAESYIVTFSKV